MQPHVRAEYTPEVRAAVAAAVGVRPDDLRDIGGFESFVHETVVEGRPVIVKATWGGRRSPEEMGAELHFVSYLADEGAPVARPLPLADGELQRAVPSGAGPFHVTAWAKARGGSIPKDAFTPDVLHQWGALVGRLHRLSTAYPGPPPPMARPAWEAEMLSVADLLTAEPDIHSRFLQLHAEISELPRCNASFGSMHTDLHRHNILWHAGEMCVIDFEDMLEFHFVSDIAVVLYYAVMNTDEDERQARYEEVRGPLFEGYDGEHRLPDEALASLPLFLSLREHELRAVILRSVPEPKRSPEWTAFLEESARRIRAEAPALGIERP